MSSQFHFYSKHLWPGKGQISHYFTIKTELLEEKKRQKNEHSFVFFIITESGNHHGDLSLLGIPLIKTKNYIYHLIAF